MKKENHPKAPSVQHDAVFRWMLAGADSLGEREVKRKVRGEDRVVKYAAVGELPKLIGAFEQAKRATRAGEIVKLIDEFDLPREAVPTQWLNEVAVWEALLERMPMTAMVRNLGKRFHGDDPNDRGMMDVVGFDTTVPAVIADFVRS